MVLRDALGIPHALQEAPPEDLLLRPQQMNASSLSVQTQGVLFASLQDFVVAQECE